ncbi:hypothetical protein PSEUDO8BK_40768 [Pseudomonas sp. 8BK]|nr:hypothetical protein PSEUDO8BK_40768 [Pseudomonas sp. 8BK]
MHVLYKNDSGFLIHIWCFSYK